MNPAENRPINEQIAAKPEEKSEIESSSSTATSWSDSFAAIPTYISQGLQTLSSLSLSSASPDASLTAGADASSTASADASPVVSVNPLINDRKTYFEECINQQLPSKTKLPTEFSTIPPKERTTPAAFRGLKTNVAEQVARCENLSKPQQSLETKIPADARETEVTIHHANPSCANDATSSDSIFSTFTNLFSSWSTTETPATDSTVSATSPAPKGLTRP